jgi:selenocysteine lyase/cysteine desulfurase
MSMLSRRRFARFLVLGGSAAVIPRRMSALQREPDPAPLPPTPARADEAFWRQVRSQFIVPADLAPLNAANLCPSPRPVLEALERETRALDTDPSPVTRRRLGEAREETRRLLAAFLGVTPDEIVITRNTSEANCMVANGLTLGSGDEVVAFADNHPSNLAAWHDKARRFGFAVREVPVMQPHPGTDAYLEAFARALTPRTRLLAVTHVTNSVGDLMPVAELCRLARERGVWSLVDGAQALGVLEVDLAVLRPDFYTGSAHKWLCGPKETGVLYVNREVHDRIHPTVVSLYPGAVGVSRKLEGMGQRDEPAMAALAEAVRFQSSIGRPAIEARARELTQALLEGVRELPGVTVWTHPSPARSAAVATFRIGALEPRRLGAALYERDRVVCAVRGGNDRPGIRLAPHLYNLMSEVERTLAALRRYASSGL